MERKWWLVIAGCFTHAVNTGLSYFGMSAFFPSFEREFGWSRTAISGAFSLARVAAGNYHQTHLRPGREGEVANSSGRQSGKVQTCSV